MIFALSITTNAGILCEMKSSDQEISNGYLLINSFSDWSTDDNVESFIPDAFFADTEKALNSGSNKYSATFITADVHASKVKPQKIEVKDKSGFMTDSFSFNFLNRSITTTEEYYGLKNKYEIDKCYKIPDEIDYMAIYYASTFKIGKGLSHWKCGLNKVKNSNHMSNARACTRPLDGFKGYLKDLLCWADFREGKKQKFAELEFTYEEVMACSKGLNKLYDRSMESIYSSGQKKKKILEKIEESKKQESTGSAEGI